MAVLKQRPATNHKANYFSLWLTTLPIINLNRSSLPQKDRRHLSRNFQATHPIWAWELAPKPQKVWDRLSWVQFSGARWVMASFIKLLPVACSTVRNWKNSSDMNGTLAASAWWQWGWSQLKRLSISMLELMQRKWRTLSFNQLSFLLWWVSA